jgi:predicted transposase/invertase (TIGR01784 family)
MMLDIRIAKDFLNRTLSNDFKQQVDLSTIKIEKESFVQDDLKKKLSDIVYSVKTKDNKKAFVYVLIESQSSSDYWIALRLWQYMLLLCERHKTKKNKLPLIAPIVFYHRSKKYDAPRNLWQLFTNPETARQLMSEDYRLVDIQSMSDDDLEKHECIGMMEYCMKHIHTRNILQLWQQILKKFNKVVLIDRDQGYIYIKALLWYTDAVLPEEQQQELSRLITENLSGGKTIMRTIAQKYIEEGMEKGMEKGIEKGAANKAIEIAVNMLKQNFDFKLVSQVTGLSTESIQKLKYSL